MLRSRKVRWYLRGLFLLVVLLNGITALQAWRLTHYLDSPGATGSPDRLTFARKLAVVFLGVRVPKPIHNLEPAFLHPQGVAWRVLTTDGLYVHAVHTPGPARAGSVFLFPKFGTSMGDLVPEARRYHQLGLDVVLVDFRSSGRSEGGRVSHGYHEALDVTAVLNEARKRGLPKPWIGHGISMGGTAVLRAMAHHGANFDGVVCESVSSSLHRRTSMRFRQMDLPDTLNPLLHIWGSLFMGFDTRELVPSEDIRRVNVPVLLLRSAMDPVHQAEDVAALAANAGGPVETVVFPLGGPCPVFRTGGALAEARLSQWLQIVNKAYDARIRPTQQ